MEKILLYLRKNARNLLYAAGTFVPLAPGVEQSSKLSSLYSSQDLATYVNRMFVFAITIGAIMAVVRLMIAGYMYMGSGDMWSSKGKAKEIFSDVIFGLLLLLSIYLILFQINPNLLNLNALDQIKNNGVQLQPVTETTAAQPTGFIGTRQTDAQRGVPGTDANGVAPSASCIEMGVGC